MKRYLLKLVYITLITFSQSACSGKLWIDTEQSQTSHKRLKLNDNFLSSGSITLSYPINTEINSANNSSRLDNYNSDKITKNSNLTESDSIRYAPIAGFFPPLASFNPADNEIWIEINGENQEIRLLKGKEQVKSLKFKGKLSLAPGEYPLQHKQKNPLWYAPDEYFEKRQLKVPPKGDTFRYRRGALGKYAIYPVSGFAVHSGPFWSEEVGGIKTSEADLASIFLMIKPGIPVVIK